MPKPDELSPSYIDELIIIAEDLEQRADALRHYGRELRQHAMRLKRVAAAARRKSVSRRPAARAR